ncbi:hypothetical protein T12_3314, partial [Trichinella patagoniensis]
NKFIYKKWEQIYISGGKSVLDPYVTTIKVT